MLILKVPLFGDLSTDHGHINTRKLEERAAKMNVVVRAYAIMTWVSAAAFMVLLVSLY